MIIAQPEAGADKAKQKNQKTNHGHHGGFTASPANGQPFVQEGGIE
jgi:hypothetical protein